MIKDLNRILLHSSILYIKYTTAFYKNKYINTYFIIIHCNVILFSNIRLLRKERIPLSKRIDTKILITRFLDVRFIKINVFIWISRVFEYIKYAK